MTYLDKTFCPFYKDCDNGDTCHRSLTPQIVEGAKKAELPICRFIEPPECMEQSSKIVERYYK